MGTAKYSAFVLFAFAVGWALRLYLLQARIADTVASGPCVTSSRPHGRSDPHILDAPCLCSQVFLHVRMFSAADSGNSWLPDF